jgi:subtilisin family serine protease
MLKQKYPFVGYLAVSMLLGTLSFAQTAKTPKDPRLLPGYNQSLQNNTIHKQETSTKQSYAKGEAIVIFEQDLSIETISSLLSQKGISIVKKFRTLSSKSKGEYLLVSGNISTEILIAKLKESSNIKSVSPNYKRTIDAVPNDPGFDQLWGLNNTGQNINGVIGTNDADINAPEAWDTRTNASATVVAVFDTGVDYTHEDLTDNMWINSAEAAGTPGVDDDLNGYTDDIYGYDFAAENNGSNDADPMDIHGHGTHVSGTIGAKGNNGVGITGVNWDANIMALKIFGPDLGAYDTDILEAIDYVLMQKDAGVNIVAVNASYGGYGGGQDDPMNTAIQTLGAADIVFCAAAGNDGEDNDAILLSHYPSSYDASNIIAVAATNQNGELASFSNFGIDTVDLAAPGVNIYSTVPDNLYAYGNGTSMATPHVTGAVALLASIDNGLSASERNRDNASCFNYKSCSYWSQ